MDICRIRSNPSNTLRPSIVVTTITYHTCFFDDLLCHPFGSSLAE